MSRFELRRRLGEGGFGVVHEAIDHETGALVAVKMLREPRPRALYHFKQEFRALAELAHVNLVRLYDLATDDERWLFSMELVDGCDLLDWVHGAGPRSLSSGSALDSTVVNSDRALDETTEAELAQTVFSTPVEQVLVEQRLGEVGPVDLDRLRDALAQLARGLAFLHRHGKLHRDIKPNNVLVTRDGQVKLLDFGLVMDLGDSDEPGMIAGTPAYMAPEAMLGRPVTPAADWYGVGVMLFEVLTGRLPYFGTTDWLLAQKLSSVPPSPAELSPGVPRDLDRLCRALLDPDPERRPSERQILTALAVEPGLAAGPQGSWRFVGRAHELAALERSFAATASGAASIALVHGRSGIGKSALGERLLERIARESADVLVLRGRCYAQESVPYKAFDGIVDSLAGWLAMRPQSEQLSTLPDDALALARLFPVLHQVPALSAAPPLPTADPLDIRRRAFAAFRGVLRQLAQRHRVVLFIDDLHWGDVDSAALAKELLGGPHPPALWLVGTYRTEEGAESELVRRLRGIMPDHGCDLELGELSPDEAEELALALLGADGAERARAIAREAGGSPFFVDELARSTSAARAGTLDQVIQQRAAELPPPARRLLEVAAVAGQPLPRAVARRAAALDRGDAHELSLLRNARFLRTRAAGAQELVETYHDRIRETVGGLLGREETARLHARLASAFEALEQGDAETLAVHHHAAGHAVRAADYLALAADQATTALAFERAARLFRRALDLDVASGDRLRRLRTGLGDALANLGRGSEAAEELRAAAALAPAFEALELRRRAAELLMNAGRIERGLEVMRGVLERVGLSLSETPRAALVGLLASRARIRWRGLGFVDRAEAALPPDALLQADACWSVASGLGIVDTVRGAQFQAKNLLLSLDLGEPRRVVRALAMEVAYASTAGVRAHARTTSLSKRTLGLALRLKDPEAIATATLASAIAAFHEGSWKRAREQAERAGRLFRAECTGVAFQLHNADMYALRSMYYLGDWDQLVRALPEQLRDAEQRGDRFATTRLIAWGGYVADLAADDPGRARQRVISALDRWGVRTPHQEWYRLMAEVEIGLFSGDAPASFRLLEDEWPKVRRSLQLRIQAARMIALHLRARAALGVIRHEPAAARIAADAARAIRQSRSGWGDPLADLVHAGLAAARGERELAIEAFSCAERGLVQSDMHGHARAARFRRGELVGGSEGATLVESCRAEWRAQGQRAPDKLARMLAP